ncbi:MAG: hypothetical protein AB1589_11440 [Cyanobacteriota bacterium]
MIPTLRFGKLLCIEFAHFQVRELREKKKGEELDLLTIGNSQFAIDIQMGMRDPT